MARWTVAASRINSSRGWFRRPIARSRSGLGWVVVGGTLCEHECGVCRWLWVCCGELLVVSVLQWGGCVVVVVRGWFVVGVGCVFGFVCRWVWVGGWVCLGVCVCVCGCVYG